MCFRVAPEYSLSRNYQIRENIVVTTRLILPLDICNAVLYIAFMLLMTLLRYLRALIATDMFYSYVESICTVMPACVAA